VQETKLVYFMGGRGALDLVLFTKVGLLKVICFEGCSVKEIKQELTKWPITKSF
jgi:hypothetical protein